MGNLSTASIQKAVADKASAELAKAGYDARRQLTPMELDTLQGLDGTFGSGLYAGTGLYAGRMRKSGGAVGLNAGMVRQLPPALQSQPYSANFQFQATLPPAYQKFSKGSGLYT